MLPVAIIALVGALWIALGLFAYAIFTALTASVGAAGAAAITGVIFIVLALVGGLLVRARLNAAKRNAMIAGLATSGVANVALGLITRKPLVTLGIAGALAAYLFTRGGDQK
jgi:hypothetical protein